jgi:hypothetical protein
MYQNTPILINGEVDLDRAAELVKEGIIEGVVVARRK